LPETQQQEQVSGIDINSRYAQKLKGFITVQNSSSSSNNSTGVSLTYSNEKV
jgi:hypothetical protein